jgi:hypothetical protein
VVERLVAAAAIHHNHHLTVIRNQLVAIHADMIGHSARLVARCDVRLRLSLSHVCYSVLCSDNPIWKPAARQSLGTRLCKHILPMRRQSIL